MKFKTHNDKEIDVNGTHLIDYITTNYKTLIKHFGNSTDGDEYKVDAEWEIEFEDGTIATIYNYKDGKNYCGDDGLDVKDITDWHIGGFNGDAVKRVKEILNGKKTN